MNARNHDVERDAALAFVDLLGFSSMVKRDVRRANEVLNDFYNIAYSVISERAQVQGNLFSDCLIAYANNVADLVNAMSDIYRRCSRRNTEYDREDAFFLLPRGGISKGIVTIESRLEAPNLTKGFILSPALVHSAEMEKSVKGSRLLIAVKDESAEDTEIRWNTDIKAVIYDAEEFRFWKHYRYADVLWCGDLAQPGEAQRTEIISLVQVLMDMVFRNSEGDSLVQYVETLRIALLSYARFCQLPVTDAIVGRLLAEFRDERYWRLWVAMVEMAMQSPDNWALPSHAGFIEFFKQVSLTKGWALLLKDINRPEATHVKELFVRLLAEMDITAT